MLKKTTIASSLIFLPWLVAGHYLLLANVHAGGVLLWIASALLLPDLIISYLVTDSIRSNIWPIVLIVQYGYVWVIVRVILSSCRGNDKGPISN